MPLDDERSYEVTCHITKDFVFLNETKRLQDGIILTQPENFERNLIAALVATSHLVTPNELSIVEIPRGKFIVLPPPHIDSVSLANATPKCIWSKEFRVEFWFSHIDSEIEIPSFQVILNIDGVSLLFWKKEFIAQAVGIFGTFLGTVTSSNEGFLGRWEVITATSDLRKILNIINFVAGGIKTVAFVRVVRWVHTPLFDN